jgi:hypothetical protein
MISKRLQIDDTLLTSTFPAKGIRKGSVQNIKLLDNAAKDEVIAKLSSIGSSVTQHQMWIGIKKFGTYPPGGTTEVIIIMQ